jgi:hypothetical protein
MFIMELGGYIVMELEVIVIYLTCRALTRVMWCEEGGFFLKKLLVDDIIE